MEKFSSGSYCLTRDFCRLCILACKKKRTRIFRSWKWKKSQRWVMSSSKNSTVKEMCPKLFLKHNDEQKVLCVLLCSMGVSASRSHCFHYFERWCMGKIFQKVQSTWSDWNYCKKMFSNKKKVIFEKYRTHRIWERKKKWQTWLVGPNMLPAL